jgi:hypothetical protein
MRGTPPASSARRRQRVECTGARAQQRRSSASQHAARDTRATLNSTASPQLKPPSLAISPRDVQAMAARGCHAPGRLRAPRCCVCGRRRRASSAAAPTLAAACKLPAGRAWRCALRRPGFAPRHTAGVSAARRPAAAQLSLSTPAWRASPPRPLLRSTTSILSGSRQPRCSISQCREKQALSSSFLRC